MGAIPAKHSDSPVKIYDSAKRPSPFIDEFLQLLRYRSRWVAEATAGVLASLRAESRDSFRESLLERRGRHHYSAAGATSWLGFARRILEKDPSAVKGEAPAIERISSAESARPAHRPAYSVLSTEKVRSEFGLTIESWKEQLQLRRGSEELAG